MRGGVGAGLGLGTVLSTCTASTCPLLEELAPFMVEELESAGIITFPRKVAVEFELFEYLRSRGAFAKLGRRTSMVRFGGFRHKAAQALATWSVDLFEVLLVSLESDWLHTRKLVEKLTIRTGANDSLGGGGSTAGASTNTKGGSSLPCPCYSLGPQCPT